MPLVNQGLLLVFSSFLVTGFLGVSFSSNASIIFSRFSKDIPTLFWFAFNTLNQFMF